MPGGARGWSSARPCMVLTLMNLEVLAILCILLERGVDCRVLGSERSLADKCASNCLPGGTVPGLA